MSDRRVHARWGGMEVVRYDRAGKWYLEPTDPTLPREAIKLAEAVDEAMWAVDHGGMVLWDQPGGGAFDRAVRRRIVGAA